MKLYGVLHIHGMSRALACTMAMHGIFQGKSTFALLLFFQPKNGETVAMNQNTGLPGLPGLTLDSQSDIWSSFGGEIMDMFQAQEISEGNPPAPLFMNATHSSEIFPWCEFYLKSYRQ